MTQDDIDILQHMDSRMQVWRKQYPGENPAKHILFALLRAAMWFRC